MADARAKGADPDELERLQTAIDKRVAEPHEEEHHHHLMDRLAESFTAFESEHPDLATVIRGTIDTLSSAGI